jgi:gluconolactonase
LATIAVFGIGTAGQPPDQATDNSDVLRLDPALDHLVPTGAKVEKITGNLQRSEGPVWIRNGGYLLLSDLNEIMKWSPTDGLSEFRHQTFKGPAPADVRVGTNGLTLDRQGHVLAVEHGDRRVVRFEKNGNITVLADHYMGRRFNSPNDLVVKRNGDVYFTDPGYLAQSAPTTPEFRRELEVTGVYRITTARKVQLLVSDLEYPNGLAFSPDEKKLYVANTRPKKLLVYDVKDDGSLSAGNVLMDISADATDGVPDGMKVDKLGNVYAAGPGGVLVISPQGKHLGTILIPEIVANCAWGDADAKTLYVAARTGLYRIRLNVAGIKP